MGQSLQAARRARGWTQERLAERAKVSVRMLRDLETGRTRRPHADSLMRIGHALGLTEVQRDALVRAWTIETSVPSFTEVVDNGRDVDRILAESSATAAGLRSLASIQHMIIGPDRHARLVEVQRVLEPLRDGLDRCWVLWGNEPGQDLSQISISEADGCELVRRVILPDQDVIAANLRFPHPLRRGGVHYQRFTWDFEGSFLDADDAPTMEYGHGWRQPPQTGVVSVTFEGPRPSRCWEAAGEDPTSIVPLREVVPNDAGSLTTCVQNPKPGLCGFRWEW